MNQFEIALEIESAIVDRLKQDLYSTGAVIEALPDKTTDLDRTYSASHVIVGFRRFQAQPPPAALNVFSAALSTTITLQFEIVIHAKDLRSHHGALGIMQAISDSIDWWAPLPQQLQRRLYPSVGGFQRRAPKDRIYVYAIDYEIQIPYQRRPPT